jgi:hypothetical protein
MSVRHVDTTPDRVGRRARGREEAGERARLRGKASGRGRGKR